MTKTSQFNAVQPPAARSSTALGLLRGAFCGNLTLQSCIDCGEIQYPPSDACRICLCGEFSWKPVDGSGILLAETLIRVSNEPYFSERLPWRIGMVRNINDVSLVCHLLPGCSVDQKVIVDIRIDESGRPVLVARPEIESRVHETDVPRPWGNEFNSSLVGKKILLDDINSPFAQELIQLALTHGASSVASAKHGRGTNDEIFIRMN
ncbi:Zn-ribbon domain-containing OB-fold protein [Glutamicibacter sp. NPDC087344]|uniref:Zn-ribbon domain-containing OB-fold protein n=1 Tax=Glutamicibacter sp. NPDC087344 TaxID=3363994 RepID=UPI00381DAAE9